MRKNQEPKKNTYFQSMLKYLSGIRNKYEYVRGKKCGCFLYKGSTRRTPSYTHTQRHETTQPANYREGYYSVTRQKTNCNPLMIIYFLINRKNKCYLL